MKTLNSTARENLFTGCVYFVTYVLAILLADAGLASVGSAILLADSVGIYILRLYYRRCPADLGALLFLFWNMGLALAILRLSTLHTPWTFQTKVCFGLFPLCFLAGECIEINIKRKKTASWVYSNDRLLWLIAAVSLISAGVFFAEAIILGYIPIFSEDTHAYNYFHVTGLHYFTVSCMMTHALTAVYVPEELKLKHGLSGWKALILAAANILSLSIAVMCISKLQFLLIFGLPLLILLGRVKIYDFRRLPWRRIILCAVLLVILFAGVIAAFTMLRHYEPGYLESIFQFRNRNVPGWFQYVYMYIANNYANFNCMTESLTCHTFGLKQLFPVFALTGTKFIFPQLVNFPLYVVKEEINTLTIIYDAYYDYGCLGVAGFGVVLGIVSRALCKIRDENKNPVFMLFYAQAAIYMVLSFFSAWYSVATTWFWFAITAVFIRVVMKKEVSHE